MDFALEIYDIEEYNHNEKDLIYIIRYLKNRISDEEIQYIKDYVINQHYYPNIKNFLINEKNIIALESEKILEHNQLWAAQHIKKLTKISNKSIINYCNDKTKNKSDCIDTISNIIIKSQSNSSFLRTSKEHQKMIHNIKIYDVLKTEFYKIFNYFFEKENNTDTQSQYLIEAAEEIRNKEFVMTTLNFIQESIDDYCKIRIFNDCKNELFGHFLDNFQTVRLHDIDDL